MEGREFEQRYTSVRDCPHTHAGISFSGENVKRITNAALGGVAACGLILGTTLTAGGVAPNILFGPETVKVTDLRPADDKGPLDDASATLRILSSDEGTGFRLRVTGIDRNWEGHDFGAHLHVGPCVTPTINYATDPVSYSNDTGGHFGVQHLPFPSNEAWLDLVPDEEGVANDEVWVGFVPVDDLPPGMSIVIHRERAALPTIQSQKEVCLPVNVDSWQ